MPVGLTDADLARIAARRGVDRAGGRRAAGFDRGLRLRERAALRVTDLAPQPGGLLLHVRRSRTDQEAGGQVVAVAPGHHSATCSLAALSA